MSQSTAVTSPPAAPVTTPPIILTSTAHHVLGAGKVTAVHAATWVATLLAGGCWTVASSPVGEDADVSWNS